MLSSTYQSTARLLLSTLYEPLPKHLISVLGTLNSRLAQRPGVCLAIRVGIHTGLGGGGRFQV